MFNTNNYRSALRRFSLMNFGKVIRKKDDAGNYAIYTFFPPNKLRYPKGWQYDNGFFCRNPLGDDKEEAIILMPTGQFWGNFV